MTGYRVSRQKGAGPALAEAIVGVGVKDTLAGQTRHVRLAGVDVLAALEHYWLEPQAQELQRGEHPRRARSDDCNRRCIVDIEKLRQPVRLVSLVRSIDLHAVAPYGFSTSVDAPSRDHAGRRRIHLLRLQPDLCVR